MLYFLKILVLVWIPLVSLGEDLKDTNVEVDVDANIAPDRTADAELTDAESDTVSENSNLKSTSVIRGDAIIGPTLSPNVDEKIGERNGTNYSNNGEEFSSISEGIKDSDYADPPNNTEPGASGHVASQATGVGNSSTQLKIETSSRNNEATYITEQPSAKRGDTDPVIVDDTSSGNDLSISIPTTTSTASDRIDNVTTTPFASPGTPKMEAVTLSTSTMSWLDAFMLQYRDSVWVFLNTFFMVIWIVIGAFALYRLLGLPWCTVHVSRTQYLIIHLMIFTASTFEFVQLIHLSYGSHEGLPLFLTLLLTHTPTPCLASSLILLIHCIFVSARVPMFGSYFPPQLYMGITTSSLIVFSFVGDIIVGVSHSSIFLLINRLLLNCVCVVCFASFISRYRSIVNVGYLMRREFQGELKSLGGPVNSIDESHNSKIHLKNILIMWSRITLISCLSGTAMCMCCFSLSIFFTVSYVPLWAFWVLHSSIFLSQLILVITVTFGATLTLSDTNRNNAFYKYFVPSLSSQRNPNHSVIKRGNFIYQRVALSNGPSNIPVVSVSPITVEPDNQDRLPKNAIVTELPTPPPLKPTVNLRRSATFNCAPPQHSFYGMSPQCSTPIYPVLSEHLLPQGPCDTGLSGVNKDASESVCNDFTYYKQTRPVTNQSGFLNDTCYISYGYVSPSRRYYGYGRRKFSSLHSSPYSTHNRPEISSPISHDGMAGAVQELELPVQPSNKIPVSDRTVFANSSFSRSKAPDNLGLSLTPTRVKPEPPEKPVRRMEPILVRGVIKDGGCLENMSYDRDKVVWPSIGISSFSNQDSIQFSPESQETSAEIYSPKFYGSLYDKNIAPSVVPKKSVAEYSELPSCSDGETEDMLMADSKTIFYAFSKAANSNSCVTDALPVSSYTLTNLSNNTPCVITSHNSQAAQKNNPLILEACCNDTLVTKSDENDCDKESVETLNHASDVESDNHSDSTLKEVSTSCANIDTEFDPSILSVDKKMSLKRNNSTAGYFPSSSGSAENGSSDFVDTKSKYPWYGTWGGRKSKRKGSVQSETNTAGNLQFGRQLKKLSGSKSSLSSIYGKLKPKRSKSLAKTSDRPLPPSDSNIEIDDCKAQDRSSDSYQVEEDEDDLFLPRLTEEIDLETEILKSSTMLYDFYSLKRSDLKKRKAEDREASHQKENDINSENDVGLEINKNELVYEDAGEHAERIQFLNDEPQNLNGLWTAVNNN